MSETVDRLWLVIGWIVCRPDLTETVHWALQTITYLPTYLPTYPILSKHSSFFFEPRLHV